jgi:hypothetical protein
MLTGAPALAALPAAIPGAAADAELVAACAAFDALEVQVQAIDAEDHPVDSLKPAEAERIRRQQRPLLARICATRARTAQGVRARAATLALYDPDVLAPTSPCWDELLTSAVVRDLLGEAVPMPSRRIASSVGADAEILAAFARWEAAHHECDALPEDDATPAGAARVRALVADMHAAELAIARLPSLTPAGTCAKASIVLHGLTLTAEGDDLYSGASEDYVLLSLLWDVVGLPSELVGCLA